MTGRIEKCDAVVVGAGVVGAAIAHKLAVAGKSVVVLEKETRIAEGVTSRNSGVVHAGIYYPKGSSKHRHCVRGNALLYEWASKKGVPFKKTGKWVVGSSAQKSELEALYDHAIDCGVPGLSWRPIRELDPAVFSAEAGFFSATSGIVDPYELSRSLVVAAEELGVLVSTRTEVLGAGFDSDGSVLVETDRGQMGAEILINASGLNADRVMSFFGFSVNKIYPCRGDYFRWHTKAQIKELIYPVRKKGDPGLGVHLTIGLDGSYRLGPDAFYVDEKDDFRDPPNVEEKKKAFYSAARKFLKLELDELEYDTCGIRPKLRAPEEQAEKDFFIEKPHPRVINLMGIESPGLTASLSIADEVTGLAKEGF